ncbi:MAG: hypothetical protein GTO02_14695, partial [Candidatus Dadabacteria bacterium]|nr:hypothetical protein [Candidatus Dadabacteria bacterium]NIQ15591.1 hypothetical protein [Candidatus Dadabacteria bacterium]
MRIIQYILFLALIILPTSLYAGNIPFVQSTLGFNHKYNETNELHGYYDLRNRNTYVQVTNTETSDSITLPTLCIHVQIFQQDQGCVELNFEDELTPNDTVIYDLDNLIRNNGTEVPINLDENSYGVVTISSFDCDNRNNDTPSALIGNTRIIDDSGYEYRMNLMGEESSTNILSGGTTQSDPIGNIIIPFNTVDGATHSDIVAFVIDDNRSASGADGIAGPSNTGFKDLVYIEKSGVTFSIFQVDENEQRISCDKKTFGCGPNVVLNYGVNEDLPASRGDNLLCEGGGLLPDQKHGYISLE